MTTLFLLAIPGVVVVLGAVLWLGAWAEARIAPVEWPDDLVTQAVEPTAGVEIAAPRARAA